MKVIGQIILALAILSCTNNRNNAAIQDSTDCLTTVDLYGFLNYVLTDTTEIGLVKDGYKVISDIEMLPPPGFFEGTFRDYLSQLLSETDTLFISNQLRELLSFRTDKMSEFGFTVVKVSELRAQKLKGEEFWDLIYRDYGQGLLTVSRPIFNRDCTKAYVRVGYSCGRLCGGGEDVIFDKVDGNWKLTESVSRWVS